MSNQRQQPMSSERCGDEIKGVSMIKFWVAACSFGLLTACGGGGSASQTVAAPEYNIEVSSLRYSQPTTFTITGTQIDKISHVNVSKCDGVVNSGASAGSSKTLTCTVSGTGDLKVELQNAQNEVLFGKTWTVALPQVQLTTTSGNLLVELDPSAAPLTVNNFLAYVHSGFYTNTLIHRVISNFVVQGGWLTNAPAVQTGQRAPIVLESNNGLSNLRGTIGMARMSEANTATSQFYFNVVDNPALNFVDTAQPGYAVFGKLVKGLDVLDAIAAQPTGSKFGLPNAPLTDVVVLKAEQLQ